MKECDSQKKRLDNINNILENLDDKVFHVINHVSAHNHAQAHVPSHIVKPVSKDDDDNQSKSTTGGPRSNKLTDRLRFQVYQLTEENKRMKAEQMDLKAELKDALQKMRLMKGNYKRNIQTKAELTKEKKMAEEEISELAALCDMIVTEQVRMKKGMLDTVKRLNVQHDDLLSQDRWRRKGRAHWIKKLGDDRCLCVAQLLFAMWKHAVFIDAGMSKESEEHRDAYGRGANNYAYGRGHQGMHR